MRYSKETPPFHLQTFPPTKEQPQTIPLHSPLHLTQKVRSTFLPNMKTYHLHARRLQY